MKKRSYQIELNEVDLGQLLEGLDQRAKAWELTAEYHRGRTEAIDFIVEECTDAHEADQIAGHYRRIIAKIEKQRQEQT